MVQARVELSFQPEIAAYIRERVWHPSQRLRGTDDGGLVLTLDVCTDWALRTWILGFGPMVRVLSPDSLVRQVREDLARGLAQYGHAADPADAKDTTPA